MNAVVRRPWLLLAGFTLGFVVLWGSALFTPFWGDDYVFLTDAHAAREAGAPFLQAFWPQAPYKFWRPLSQETYWRLIEQLWGGHALAAHAANLLWHLLSCGAVAALAHTLAVQIGLHQPRLLALLAASAYGLHGLHVLPVHWVAATNSAMLITWVALGWTLWGRLGALPVGPTVNRWRAVLLVAGVLVLQALALVSKESAILWPALALLLSRFAAPNATPNSLLNRWQWVAWALCVGLCLLWWVLRQRFTAQVESNYAMTLGSNLFVNAAAMAAWLMNVPREAVRWLMLGDLVRGAVWCALVLVPMGLGLGLLWRAAVVQLGARRLAWCLAFVLVASAPYLLLAQQSYAYYAAMALVLPAFVFAAAAAASRTLLPACALFFLASVVNVKGSEWAEQPALLARARWAEANLARLASEPVHTPVLVQVRDPQQFYAIGTAGLAWRLNVPPNQVRVAAQCAPEVGHWLHQDEQGHLVWKTCDGRKP